MTAGREDPGVTACGACRRRECLRFNVTGISGSTRKAVMVRHGITGLSVGNRFCVTGQ